MNKIKTFFKLYFGSLIPPKVKNYFLGFSFGKGLLFLFLANVFNIFLITLGLLLALVLSKPRLQDFAYNATKKFVEYTKVLIKEADFTKIKVGPDYWDADFKKVPYKVEFKVTAFTDPNLSCLKNVEMFSKCVTKTPDGLVVDNPNKAQSKVQVDTDLNLATFIFNPKISGDKADQLQDYIINNTFAFGMIFTRDYVIVLSMQSSTAPKDGQGKLVPLKRSGYRVEASPLFEDDTQLPAQAQGNIEVVITKQDLYKFLDQLPDKLMESFPYFMTAVFYITTTVAWIFALLFGIFGTIRMAFTMVFVAVFMMLLGAVVFTNTSKSFKENFKLAIPVVVGVNLWIVLLNLAALGLAILGVIDLTKALEVFAFLTHKTVVTLLLLGFAFYTKMRAAAEYHEHEDKAVTTK